LFGGGELYYRQLDELSITVLTARTLRDEDWRVCLDGAHAVWRKLGRPPMVGIIFCLHAFPSARQRQMSNEFMAQHYQRPMLRVAIMTDRAIMRTAMTAMRWVIPQLTLRAFEPTQIAPATQWLREVGTFDVPSVVEAWSDALAKLGIRLAAGKGA
ncbi:MAG: STAS/SEC14 domain-containing protein, partial [Polyangiaceae bacterium]